MEMKYEIGFVFFIESENQKESIRVKDKLLDVLDDIDIVQDYDVSDDGEDWNIECKAVVESENDDLNSIASIFEKALQEAENSYSDASISCCWDYHYIKGLENDFYWHP